MSKSIYRLSDIAVRAATAGTTLNDGGGLLYRATAKSAGRWVFKFTSGDPDYLARQAAKGSALRQREMGLGAFPATPLAVARDKADAARKQVAQGLDPIEETRRAAEAAEAQAEAAAKAMAADAMTFGRYADEFFLPSVLPNFSNPAHVQQWRATFATHAAALRNRPLASITREDVLAILRPIWTKKSVTASRSRERIERLFAHAIQNGQFHRDNPAAWRQFDATLPSPKKLTRGHHPAVPHDRISAFMAVLRAKQPDSEAALMLEWITLAACRTGEARFAVWGEIDLVRNVWSIPAARMKMRRDHVVPITARMVEILAEAERRHKREPAPTDYVFVGGKGKPLTEMAALMLIRRMEAFKDYTGHGLRATFKGWAATCTEFPRELIEEQLAHQLGAVEQAYMRVSAVERRRPMMEAWADHCEPPAALLSMTPVAAAEPPKRGRGRPPLSEEIKQQRIEAAKARLDATARSAGMDFSMASEPQRRRLALLVTADDRALLRAAGMLPAAKVGRDWKKGSTDSTAEAITRDDAAEVGRGLAAAGAGSENAAARQALFEARYGDAGRRAIAEAEWKLAFLDFGGDPADLAGLVLPEDGISLSVPERSHNETPAPDGFPARWVSPVFATKKGLELLRSSGLDVPQSVQSTGADIEGVHAVAHNIRRHATEAVKAGQRAADAYCAAVLAFEAEHGLVRVEDGWPWRYASITPQQHEALTEYARAAAMRAANEIDRPV